MSTYASDSAGSLAGQLAEYFRQRPNQWIDGRVLAGIAGGYAWRTRCSDIRRPPFRMVIKNRQRRQKRPDGSSFVVSEYCYRAAESREAA